MQKRKPYSAGISRKVISNIYDYSMRLRKERGFGSLRITKFVGKKFKVNFYTGTIEGWINKNRTPLKPIPSKMLLYNLYQNKKLSVAQIAKQLRIGKTSVHRHLKGYKIEIRSVKEGQKLRLQEDGKFGGYIKEKLAGSQKQVILGTLMGDGSLYLGKRYKNARLKISHSEKDKDYLIYKHSVLRNFATGKIMKEIKHDKKSRKTYFNFTFITVTHPKFMKFYELFYIGKKKIVNNKILKQLTPLSLAVWTMDDGYYNRKHKFMDLYTMNFTYDEHLIMQDWFEKNYKIFPKINYHKQADGYHLRFNTTDTKKLIKIIKPFIISCMKRKIE